MVGPARQEKLGLPGASWQVQAVWHAADVQEVMPSSAQGACSAEADDGCPSSADHCHAMLEHCLPPAWLSAMGRIGMHRSMQAEQTSL